MAMMYSTLSRSPELEPHQLMQFSVIPWILLFKEGLTFQPDILSPINRYEKYVYDKICTKYKVYNYKNLKLGNGISDSSSNPG